MYLLCFVLLLFFIYAILVIILFIHKVLFYLPTVFKLFKNNFDLTINQNIHDFWHNQACLICTCNVYTRCQFERNPRERLRGKRV